MHHYKLAKGAVEEAVRQATEAGWSEQEILQSLIVVAVEGHAARAGAQSTRSMLQFEMSNISDTVDYDFVRSR